MNPLAGWTWAYSPNPPKSPSLFHASTCAYPLSVDKGDEVMLDGAPETFQMGHQAYFLSREELEAFARTARVELVPLPFAYPGSLTSTASAFMSASTKRVLHAR